MAEISDSEKSAKREFELQKRELWEHIEERLDRRAARTRATIILVVALVSAVGISSLFFGLKGSIVSKVEGDIQEQTKFMRDRLTKDLGELSIRSESLTGKLERTDAKAKVLMKKSEETNKRADQLLKDLNKRLDLSAQILGKLETTATRLESTEKELLSRLETAQTDIQVITNLQKSVRVTVDQHAKEIKTINDESMKSLKEIIELVDNFRGVNEQFEALSKSLGSMEQKLAKLAETTLATLTDAEKYAIQVKQVPRRLDEKLVELTFSIHVETDDQQQRSKVINMIERVIYHFDEEWFSNPSIVRLNRFNNFKTSMRVWGSTQVKVDIYVRGMNTPITRGGSMNLYGETFFRKS